MDQIFLSSLFTWFTWLQSLNLSLVSGTIGKQSAWGLFFPAPFLISKLNCPSFSDHLANKASGSLATERRQWLMYRDPCHSNKPKLVLSVVIVLVVQLMIHTLCSKKNVLFCLIACKTALLFSKIFVSIFCKNQLVLLSLSIFLLFMGFSFYWLPLFSADAFLRLYLTQCVPGKNFFLKKFKFWVFYFQRL